ncbi:UDP-3-O-(3-hydroxymyristoyl)glucosamine N-acyltransferase [Legionella bononiensis]|uniref:UDP-3-O-(3-hydroxymyristoyl)glucosamine N-acyltransferase n=1 Tax=Legionella bononiensis TaxID=2793102 RepID=A0ABS1W8Z2_9GAMM|nr:UDP-3-O-(3-hydroxymyristoyl)glucosamine N-acyltransferase [Legionella bononiensis]MBL7479661.1 UDP-3-O-(3-hydroxymyristoyl)glucosamine N-acyltransferase [Legionella bononiensis]MBL7525827.1 UDP-3-O-(3-hydroxymyristoyl)glucosamine N-acyltransferase [Legionella bononiensis]MBL7562367.1 UDP-3-O-(3-hydroxymyristoyl)glucosamine N-acyltransferase [Legionella bononiensis]
MLTLAQLADFLDGVWHGNANHAIFGLSSLVRATSKDVAYFDNPLLHNTLTQTAAGAVILKSEHVHLCPVNSIVVSNPLASMNEAVKLFSPGESPNLGIHETARIHHSAQLGNQVSIGAYSVIGEHVQIADGVILGANTVIESAVSIGKDSRIGCGVMIHSGCRLGNNVRVNSGCIIGSSPFNYMKQHGVWQQGPDVGAVILSDEVQLGANTVIDRGSLSDTYLGEGVCVDNLVQIAHDVFIGSNTAIAGCAAIGAYAHIGSDCIIGGASCIAAYVRLTDDTVITGMSTVSKSIAKSGIYSSGTLVHEHDRWRRNAARFKRLDDYMIKLGLLEKQLKNDDSLI